MRPGLHMENTEGKCEQSAPGSSAPATACSQGPILLPFLFPPDCVPLGLPRWSASRVHQKQRAFGKQRGLWKAAPPTGPRHGSRFWARGRCLSGRGWVLCEDRVPRVSSSLLSRSWCEGPRRAALSVRQQGTCAGGRAEPQSRLIHSPRAHAHPHFPFPDV